MRHEDVHHADLLVIDGASPTRESRRSTADVRQCRFLMSNRHEGRHPLSQWRRQFKEYDTGNSGLLESRQVVHEEIDARLHSNRIGASGSLP